MESEVSIKWQNIRRQWLSLPEPIVYYIVRFCDAENKLKLRESCKYFSKKLSIYPLFENLTIRKGVVTMLMKNGTTQMINIGIFKDIWISKLFIEDVDFSSPLMLDFYVRCVSVSHLEVYFDEMSPNQFKSMSSLESVKSVKVMGKNRFPIGQPTLIEDLLSMFPNATSIRTLNFSLATSLETSEYLTYLQRKHLFTELILDFFEKKINDAATFLNFLYENMIPGGKVSIKFRQLDAVHAFLRLRQKLYHHSEAEYSAFTITPYTICKIF